MFIYTLKASSIKFFAVIILSVAVLAVIVAVVPDFDSIGEVAAVNIDYEGIKTDEDRREFLAGFGYELESKSVDAAEVTVPDQFDSVYDSYNEIQRAQGLNLEKYKGKEVMRYTYKVSNYEYEGSVYATVLVFKNKIIAGDICSADGKGFIHGFDKPV